MFSGNFLQTKEEYRLAKEQEAQREKSLMEQRKMALMQERQREQEEIRRYIQMTRPELIQRVDKILTLILNPAVAESVTYFEPSRDTRQSLGGGGIADLGRLHAKEESWNGSNASFPLDTSSSSGELTRGNDTSFNQDLSQISSPSHQSINQQSSILDSTINDSSTALNSSSETHMVASRRSSLATVLPSTPVHSLAHRQPPSTKLRCQYSLKFPPPDSSLHLRTLGKDGYVASFNELVNGWSHLLNVMQFEAYYLRDHQGMQMFFSSHGSKIQRLFLKIHPHAETFLFFKHPQENQLLIENLNVLHLEIPRSLRDPLSKEMPYLLNGVLEVFLHVQKEKYSASSSFYTVNDDLFQEFVKTCNKQLRHCSIEGFSLTKQWISQLLENFSSLKSVHIGMCRRVIAREENDVVKHSSPEKEQNEEDAATESPAQEETTQEEEEETNHKDTPPPPTKEATQKKPAIHTLKNTEQREELDPLAPVEPLITLHTPHTSLTRVALSQSDAVNDVTILTLCTNAPNITKLSVSETYATRRSLLFITQHLRKLKELSFFGPKLVCPLKLSPLPELSRLELNGHHCSVDALITLSTGFPKLSWLHLGSRRNVFRGESIDHFIEITRGEDAKKKERFLSYVMDLMPQIFEEYLEESKDVDLECWNEELISIIEMMKRADSQEDTPQDIIRSTSSSILSTSPGSPMRDWTASQAFMRSGGSPMPSPSSPFQSSPTSSATATTPFNNHKTTPLRRNTLALPTVRRRLGFELFLDRIYDFLDQYAILDDLAKKEEPPKKKGLKKKTGKKKKKKGKSKGKKKKKKK